MEHRGQCIAVVSGKGGTGKTSFTAGVGAALALSGRRVLCLDCDIGLRNLDLALGLSDRTLMDFSDVAQNRCSLDLAAVEHPKIPGLFLLTAPARLRGRPVTEAQMTALLQEVRRRYDFCLLDAPAGLGTGFQLATCRADRCVVVTTADASSLRDAQHTVMELNRFPAGALHLVVNRVRKKLLRQLQICADLVQRHIASQDTGQEDLRNLWHTLVEFLWGKSPGRNRYCQFNSSLLQSFRIKFVYCIPLSPWVPF